MHEKASAASISDRKQSTLQSFFTPAAVEDAELGGRANAGMAEDVSEQGPDLPNLTHGAAWVEHRDGLEMKLTCDTGDISDQSALVDKVLLKMGELFPLFRDQFRVSVYDTSGEEIIADRTTYLPSRFSTSYTVLTQDNMANLASDNDKSDSTGGFSAESGNDSDDDCRYMSVSDDLSSTRVTLFEGVAVDVVVSDAMGQILGMYESAFVGRVLADLNRLEGPKSVSKQCGAGQIGSECGFVALDQCAYSVLHARGNANGESPINFEAAPNPAYKQKVEKILTELNVDVLAHAKAGVQKCLASSSSTPDLEYFEELVEKIEKDSKTTSFLRNTTLHDLWLSALRRRLLQQWTPDEVLTHFTVVPIKADGGCLFHSLATYEQVVSGESGSIPSGVRSAEEGKACRERVCNELKSMCDDMPFGFDGVHGESARAIAKIAADKRDATEKHARNFADTLLQQCSQCGHSTDPLVHDGPPAAAGVGHPRCDACVIAFESNAVTTACPHKAHTANGCPMFPAQIPRTSLFEQIQLSQTLKETVLSLNWAAYIALMRNADEWGDTNCILAWQNVVALARDDKMKPPVKVYALATPLLQKNHKRAKLLLIASDPGGLLDGASADGAPGVSPPPICRLLFNGQHYEYISGGDTNTSEVPVGAQKMLTVVENSVYLPSLIAHASEEFARTPTFLPSKKTFAGIVNNSDPTKTDGDGNVVRGSHYLAVVATFKRSTAPCVGCDMDAVIVANKLANSAEESKHETPTNTQQQETATKTQPPMVTQQPGGQGVRQRGDEGNMYCSAHTYTWHCLFSLLPVYFASASHRRLRAVPGAEKA